MNELITREGGRLAGATIAILMESDYVEPELHYYRGRFAEEGASTVFVTRLWGQPSLTFHGHEYQQPFTVDADIEDIEGQLSRFDAIIVPSGMVSDRLRYTEDVHELAPAVRLIRAAFAEPSVLKGIICHGMWLVAPIPEVVAGRRVTCHNNLVSDVRNMGAIYTDQDIVVDGDLVTGRSADHCHLFARMIIELVAARRTPRRTPRPVVAVPTVPAAGAIPAIPAVPATPAIPATPAAPIPAARHAAPAGPIPPAAAARHAAPAGTGYVPDFPFADLVSGYVTAYRAGERLLTLRTSDGRPVHAVLAPTVAAEFLRNLGDPYEDASAYLDQVLIPGRHLFAHGIFTPEHDGYTFSAHRLILTGHDDGQYAFDNPEWWVRQLREIARFHRMAQFGDAYPVDFSNYRTVLRLGGDKTDEHIQETDTISRFIYGMASAYMLTGEDDYLHVAQRGAEYMREHLRIVDREHDIVYWYHGLDLRDGAERRLLGSRFGDDDNTVPMYEQIYALAGLTQLYRITGDPDLRSDIDGTLRMMRRYYHDPQHGGYFSHLDPVLLRPDHESLGSNRAKKNWNSIGDHAPAYLFNLYLATGDQRHADMLEETFDLIVRHLPQPDSPFVQERFNRDWSPDRSWQWQRNRAVIGHNLKIAWNLTRMMSIRPKPEYQRLAGTIARAMPLVGGDSQRGGWYDVVERQRQDHADRHDFAWHDHKAWWQQEQAILAYQILAGTEGGSGTTSDGEFRRIARESAAFYNAFFLDHDDGGVYGTVLADGTPYLMGNERLKGNHAMSMYHTAELCYLATVYQRLLLDGTPLTMWFRPNPSDMPGRTLRVSPDALPYGSVGLAWVEIDGQPWNAFDAKAMTVLLPQAQTPVSVRVGLAAL